MFLFMDSYYNDKSFSPPANVTSYNADKQLGGWALPYVACPWEQVCKQPIQKYSVWTETNIRLCNCPTENVPRQENAICGYAQCEFKESLKLIM